MVSRVDLTQARIRFILVCAFIAVLHLFLSNASAFRSRLEFDQTKYLSVDAAKQFCEFRRFEPWTKRDKYRKIYDLILINRELEWLDIRLGQMYSHVDYFIVVEADKSFTNEPKTLYVKENWDRYAAYHDKMIRHTLSDRREGI